MRISDWSSDVCSSDLSAVLVRLSHGHIRIGTFQRLLALGERDNMEQLADYCLTRFPGPPPPDDAPGRDEDRKSVVEGKSVSVRVDLGGRRIINKKTLTTSTALALDRNEIKEKV